MADLVSITSAPVPGRAVIQIFTKISGETLSLAFWDSDFLKREIGAHVADNVGPTTPGAQVTDVQFNGTTIVLGFALDSRNAQHHRLSILSPAFQLLHVDAMTMNTYKGLSSCTTDKGESFVYFLS